LSIPQDLAAYLKADSSVNLDNYYSAAVKDFQFQGKQNGMPRETTATILIYNKDIFQKGGVSLPTDTWKWADYLDAVQKLTSGSGPNKTWGTAGWIQASYMYYKEHVRLTTQPIEEPTSLDHLLEIFEMIDAAHTLLFSSDYPHWDFDDPFWAFRFVPDDLKRRIFSETARELYNLPESPIVSAEPAAANRTINGRTEHGPAHHRTS